MKIPQLLLPAIGATTAAALLALHEDGAAYDTLGFQLPTDQRDFRVYNNFSDASANNNTIAHAQWPGFTGAPLAIWKGCVEWGSSLHGDGSGDPSQVDGIGNGGANFDATFQGLAGGPGHSNANVHSEITGSGNGVVAFAEAPGSNGWRIRYYSSWTWADGPGTGVPGAQKDLQGVAAHEYGHALGLGHSGNASATMFPSITLTGVPDRSMHADDIAGVKAIYGAMSANKLHIDYVIVIGNEITVVGSNFPATDNSLWFTFAGGGGAPATVAGLSSDGTTITATIPGQAVPGDVLVKASFSGGASLSNAYPFNPDGSLCPAPTTYCSTAPNSVGTGASISASGSQSVGANALELEALGLPPGQNGIFFYGPDEAALPFGDGNLCVTGMTGRLDVLQSDVLGFVSFTLDVTDPPTTATQITPGSSWNFQYWYRDPQGPGGTGFNLSDAISVPFCQ